VNVTWSPARKPEPWIVTVWPATADAAAARVGTPEVAVEPIEAIEEEPPPRRSSPSVYPPV